jgi:hypothetical protein
VFYSADALDNDIAKLSKPAFAVNKTVLATLPQIDDTGVRDSGVYTTVLGINLRDQVRFNESVPLQFRYEAAGCRIDYSLANVFNMSRLWRDAVAAAFDDPGLCINGSRGFNNADSAYPQPTIVQPVALNFDPSGYDAGLIAETLDQSGGPQGADRPALSGVTSKCYEDDSCPFLTQRCMNIDTTQCFIPRTVKRCVPLVKDARSCRSGSRFEVIIEQGEVRTEVAGPRLTESAPPGEVAAGGVKPKPIRLTMTQSDGRKRQVAYTGVCILNSLECL